MKTDYYAMDSSDAQGAIETAGSDQSFPWMKPGVVYNFDGASGEYGPVEHTPVQARALAAALLQAADEAEGVKPPRAGNWAHVPAGRAGTRSTAANLSGDLPCNQDDEGDS